MASYCEQARRGITWWGLLVGGLQTALAPHSQGFLFRRFFSSQRALLLFFILVFVQIVVIFVIAWFLDRLGRVSRVEFHYTVSLRRRSLAKGGAREE